MQHTPLFPRSSTDPAKPSSLGRIHKRGRGSFFATIATYSPPHPQRDTSGPHPSLSRTSHSTPVATGPRADSPPPLDGRLVRLIRTVEANPLDDGFFERVAAAGLAVIGATTPEPDARETLFLASLIQSRLLALSTLAPERVSPTLDAYGDFLTDRQRADIRRVTDLAHRLSRASAIGAAIARCPDRLAWRRVGKAAAEYEFPGDCGFAEMVDQSLHMASTRAKHDDRGPAFAAQNRLLAMALPARNQAAATSRPHLLGRYFGARNDWQSAPPTARHGLAALLRQQSQGRVPIEDDHARALFHLAIGMAIGAPQGFRLIDLASQPFNRLPPTWRRHLLRLQAEVWRRDFSHTHIPNAALVRHVASEFSSALSPHGLAVDFQILQAFPR